MNPTLEALRNSGIGVAVGAGSRATTSTQREGAWRSSNPEAARASSQRSRDAASFRRRVGIDR